MPERDADKMAERPERTRRAGGGTAEGTGRAHQTGTAREGNVGDGAPMLMEEVCARENLVTAYRRVARNKGAPGIDGMTVEELMPHCRSHWSKIREELLNGTYQPKPIRRVSIPKPDGKGIRLLGIPTVLDRLIQQALLQVLPPIFDPTFSEDSYGFRPGRGAQDAVRRARNHMMEGQTSPSTYPPGICRRE